VALIDRLYAGPHHRGAGILRQMDHWSFVAAAYALVFGVLLVYWRRVERGIQTLTRPADPGPGGPR